MVDRIFLSELPCVIGTQLFDNLARSNEDTEKESYFENTVNPAGSSNKENCRIRNN